MISDDDGDADVARSQVHELQSGADVFGLMEVHDVGLTQSEIDMLFSGQLAETADEQTKFTAVVHERPWHKPHVQWKDLGPYKRTLSQSSV